jgi:hypothetical protein
MYFVELLAAPVVEDDDKRVRSRERLSSNGVWIARIAIMRFWDFVKLSRCWWWCCVMPRKLVMGDSVQGD